MPRPVELEDFARFAYVSDPNISPDGARTAYVLSTVSLDERRYQSNIWIVENSGESSPRRLTSHTGKDTAPKWSPDGRRIAFLSDRSGKSQVHQIDLDGGEASRFTNLADGVRDYAWSPDGQSVVFVTKSDDNGVLSTTDETGSEKDDKHRSDVKVIRRLQYKRDGEGFLDERPVHIGIARLDGTIRQVTTGDFDHAQPVWSPCGRYIAFVSNRTDERDRNRVADIWVHTLATGRDQAVTASDGSFGAPAFSPDGSKISFIGNQFSNEYGPVTIAGIWVADLPEGAPRLLTPELDREIGDSCTSDTHYITPAQRPAWSTDGESIFCTASDHGAVHLIRVDLDGRVERIIEGDRETLNLSASQNGAIACTVADATSLPDVYFLRPDKHGESLRLTNHNREVMDSIALSPPERLPVRTADGIDLDAWIITPPGMRAGVKYPLVLEIHGGPHAMYGYSLVHEFQALASRGYVVAYGNPRGSTGYGQEFVAAALGDWGGVDYRDVMAIVDAACDLDFVDEQRLGVTGGSYGGYLTNWILTQTDRFNAAVSQRSTANRHNLFGTSDLIWSFSEWEFNGLPFNEVDFYYDRSPITYVDSVTTPVLLLHSEQDHRCPIEQSEQFFTALKRLRRTAEFVRFPDESHNLSRSGRPDRRLERLRRMSDWFGRYL